MDSFEEQITKARIEAVRKYEEARRLDEERENAIRQSAELAFQKARSFNSRVLHPLISEFASTSKLGEFKFECHKSTASPELVHTCLFHSQRISVALRLAVDRLPRLCVSFGSSLKPSTYEISSFEEPGLDSKVEAWLKEELLSVYKQVLDMYPHFFE